MALGEQPAVPLGYVVLGLAARSAGTPDVLAWCGALLFLSGAGLLAVPGRWTVRRGGNEEVGEGKEATEAADPVAAEGA
ncbi:hypothetical protein [Streptomyces sp. NPDC007088]|uniref:hypothetical protein n=1 Tax=Streptomyces sp. NPDC007088 TaxID=3364773 RepID=UPI003676C2B3